MKSFIQLKNEEIDPDDPKHWSIVSYGKHETQSGKAMHTVIDHEKNSIEAFDRKVDAHHWLKQAKSNYKKRLKEDAPAMSAGAGNVAGIGVGAQGEPGISPKRKKFAGATVFTVPTKNFVMARMLKRKYQRFEQYLGDPSISREIAEYANANYNDAIVLEDERTGAMCFLRYGKAKR